MKTSALRRKVLIATTNPKKRGEMLQILEQADLGLEFVTLADYPEAPEVDEIGDTFLANSRIKAEAAAALSGLVTIADDGGLCIDALGGRPGVKSHRFLGADTSFAQKMTHILEMMADVPLPERTCRFHCAVVIVVPGGETFECEGVCEGVIGDAMSGANGFGYDPIFYLPEQGRYMAELSPAEKHSLSHRGKALACASDQLIQIFSGS